MGRLCSSTGQDHHRGRRAMMGVPMGLCASMIPCPIPQCQVVHLMSLPAVAPAVNGAPSTSLAALGGVPHGVCDVSQDVHDVLRGSVNIGTTNLIAANTLCALAPPPVSAQELPSAGIGKLSCRGRCASFSY